MSSTRSLIQVENATKNYRVGATEFCALNNVTLTADPGEFVLLVGKSGSGKSTLLSLLSGVERPTSGSILVGTTPIHTLPERALAPWRGRTVGIVFQFFQLLPTLTALENVLLPMDFGDVWPAKERRERAMALLHRLGVESQADKLPNTLSGGQQQRVAVARALANDPPLLLADEPTGNLDSHTSEEMLTLFRALASEGRTIIMATHDLRAAQYATRTLKIADGAFVPEET